MKAYRTLALLRRAVFLVSMPFFILGLLLPVYGKQIGASVLEIELFFSAFSLVTVLLRPLVGWAFFASAGAASSSPGWRGTRVPCSASRSSAW